MPPSRYYPAPRARQTPSGPVLGPAAHPVLCPLFLSAPTRPETCPSRHAHEELLPRTGSAARKPAPLRSSPPLLRSPAFLARLHRWDARARAARRWRGSSPALAGLFAARRSPEGRLARRGLRASWESPVAQAARGVADPGVVIRRRAPRLGHALLPRV